jgi:hypothetical protein
MILYTIVKTLVEFMMFLFGPCCGRIQMLASVEAGCIFPRKPRACRSYIWLSIVHTLLLFVALLLCNLQVIVCFFTSCL